MNPGVVDVVSMNEDEVGQATMTYATIVGREDTGPLTAKMEIGATSVIGAATQDTSDVTVADHLARLAFVR